MANIHGDAGAWSRAIVIIHGAGDWQNDYSKPMLETIQGFIGTADANQIERVEVNYSDVVTSSAAQEARAKLGAAQNAFMNTMVQERLQTTMAGLAPDQILKQLISQAPQLIGLGTAVLFPGSDFALNSLSQIVCGKSLAQLRNDVVAGIGPTIQDVCLYLYATAFENQIRQRLIDKLHEAQKYDEVILVSHSLGTVVAFDVLNAWTEDKPNISVWFTMGCPLAKVLRLASGRQPQLSNPKIVGRWFNVYNTHDIVANMLSPTFFKDSVYDIFVEAKANDPLSAHDYFTNPNALKLVADALQVF